MKKILVLIFLFICSAGYANYATPGTGVSWNMDSLVAYSGGNVTMSGSDYLVNDTVTLSPNDTLLITTNAVIKMAAGVFLDISGKFLVTPPDSATITAQDTTVKFLGIRFNDLADGSVLKKTIFEYGNSIRMLDCDILIDSCIIRHNRLNSSFASSAINFFRSNSTVSNCKIYLNRRSAIAGGANIANSPQIIDNHIYDNNTDNANVPQINFGAAGPVPVVIRGNLITGGPYIMAGGISFLPVGSIPLVIIENNVIKHNRYGIALQGGSINAYINNNVIDSNNIQNSPALGGSGINFNGASSQVSVVTRNIIRGNLWGITIQNTAKPNLGNLSNADTTDVGLNQIYDNMNTGQIYDLFNNTPDSIYAENNYWGTGNVDSVEAHISHNPDNPALGYVKYLPLRAMVLTLNVGLEGLVRASGRMGRKDSVTVYLREVTAPYSIVDSARSFVDTALYTGTFRFTSALDGMYYMVVKHFNSIETWSRIGGELFTVSGPNTYSFIDDSAKAYGGNTVLTRTRYCNYTGDVDQNGVVNQSDLIPIYNDATAFVTGNRIVTDLTGDSIVDLRDITRVTNNITRFVTVKSPLP